MVVVFVFTIVGITMLMTILLIIFFDDDDVFMMIYYVYDYDVNDDPPGKDGCAERVACDEEAAKQH